MQKTIYNGSQSEIDILARVLANDQGELPADIARYILTLGFSEKDKARSHDLAVRNQDDALSRAEKEELFAYAKADALLAILLAKARRVLGVKRKKRATT